jgi:hypothetical protein
MPQRITQNDLWVALIHLAEAKGTKALIPQYIRDQFPEYESVYGTIREDEGLSLVINGYGYRVCHMKKGSTGEWKLHDMHSDSMRGLWHLMAAATQMLELKLESSND